MKLSILFKLWIREIVVRGRMSGVDVGVWIRGYFHLVLPRVCSPNLCFDPSVMLFSQSNNRDTGPGIHASVACAFCILFSYATVHAVSDTLLPFKLISRAFYEIKSEEFHMQVHLLRFFRCFYVS